MAFGFRLRISKAAYDKVMKKSRGKGQRSSHLTNRDRSVIELYRLQQRKKPKSIYGYLKGNKITNWTGLKLCDVTSRKASRQGFVDRMGFRSARVHVKARCFDGRQYVGAGPGDGMYVRLRPKKGGR